MIKSYNISDAKTLRNKRIRSFIVVVGIVLMTTIYMVLLHFSLNFFGIAHDIPVREMEGEFVLLILLLMLIGLLFLIVLLLLSLAEIFHRLKV